MSTANNLLREVIDELASEVRDADDLAGRAMARGKAMRTRRRLAVGALSLLALALVAVPTVALRDTAHRDPRPGTIDERSISETEPRELVDGWQVTAVGRWILDRAQNRYVELADVGTRKIVPAPSGDVAAVVERSGPRQTTIEFVTAGGRSLRSVSITDTMFTFAWSPQSDRLVTTTMDEDGLGFATIDAATGQIRRHRIDHGRYNCSQCNVVWTRDGREVSLAIADRSGGESRDLTKHLQLFDAETGTPTRSIPVAATILSPFSWSPSGRYVIGQRDALRDEYQLIDVATGQATPFPHNAIWISDDRLVVPTSPSVVILRRDGTPTHRFTLEGPLATAGNVVLGPTP